MDSSRRKKLGLDTSPLVCFEEQRCQLNMRSGGRENNVLARTHTPAMDVLVLLSSMPAHGLCTHPKRRRRVRRGGVPAHSIHSSCCYWSTLVSR